MEMPAFLKRDWPKLACGVAALVGVFVGATYLAHAHQHAIESVVRAGGVAGPAAFVLLTATFIVFLIPLDVSVLIPIAVAAWGPWVTAGLSIAGWTLGSSIALAIARRYGQPLVERLVGRDRVASAGRHAPHTHLFWWVVVTQALVQVDFLSYLFGLFTPIPLASYALATAIGDLVPGLFFAFVGTLPPWYEVLALIAGLAVTGTLFWRFTRRA